MRPRRLSPADSSGAVTVEMALVLLPLLLLMLGILEVAVMIVTEAVMDGAARAAGRQVLTGGALVGGDPAKGFTDAFCAALYLGGCEGYNFDARVFADFTDVAIPEITFDETGKPENAEFQSAGPGQVVVIRVLHDYRFITPLVGRLLGGADNAVPLVSAMVLRTEPFAP